jgi:large subunit ribosomal protein L31
MLAGSRNLTVARKPLPSPSRLPTTTAQPGEQTKEERSTVKPEIHPELHLVTAVCACGNTFQVHSTQDEIRLEICNDCHPFFTGKQKLIDSAGRVERFRQRYGTQPRG